MKLNAHSSKSEFIAGDTVYLHQRKLHESNKNSIIMRIFIGFSYTSRMESSILRVVHRRQYSSCITNCYSTASVTVEWIDQQKWDKFELHSKIVSCQFIIDQSKTCFPFSNPIKLGHGTCVPLQCIL